MTPESSAKADYYARASSWAEDRDRGRRRARDIAWLVAGIAVAIASLEAVALALLMPLKTIVPYTFLVDRHTGYVQVLKGNGPDRLTADEALTHALLAQYVIAREGFDIATLRGDYRKVALWSAGKARSSYFAAWEAANPDSPLQRLPRTTLLTVRVKSVSPLAPGAALVRFDVQRLDQGQPAGDTGLWAAVIRYRFVGGPAAFEDRIVNPLGFQVTDYRKDQEAPPAPVLAGRNGDVG